MEAIRTKVRCLEEEVQVDQVLDRIKHELAEGAVGVGLAGSRSRGEQRAESDIDLVVIRQGISPWGEYDLIRLEKSIEIQVIRIPPHLEGDNPNTVFLRELVDSTRWLVDLRGN